MDTGGWVALFSGGKDSSWALHQARLADLPVTRLLTAQPAGDAYLYHTPATNIADLLAESIGISYSSFPVEKIPDPATVNVGQRGDDELDRLASAIEGLAAELPGGVTGLITGTVASQYQFDRINRLCERYEFDSFHPLWHCTADEALHEMVDAGFDIRIITVAADGLDRSWLGRKIDDETIAALLKLAESRGIHPMGEGGEFETLVVNGPHMDRPLSFEATEQWEGLRGELCITRAWLDESNPTYEITT